MWLQDFTAAHYGVIVYTDCKYCDGYNVLNIIIKIKQCFIFIRKHLLDSYLPEIGLIYILYIFLKLKHLHWQLFMGLNHGLYSVSAQGVPDGTKSRVYIAYDLCNGTGDKLNLLLYSTSIYTLHN